MEAINTKMFLSIAADVNSKAIHRQHSLRWRGNNKTSHKIGFAARFTEKFVRKKGGLIEVAHEIGESGDIVWEVAATTRPDCQEGDGIKATKCDKGVVGWHQRGNTDLFVIRIPERDEYTTSEDGNCHGDKAHE